MDISHGFNCIADSGSKVLILGSLPSVKSIEKQEYYGNPRNHFWKIILTVYGEDYTDDYNQRKNVLLKNNIALWDILACAQRKGSLDSAIKSEIVNDIESFLIEHNQIRLIVFNGTSAKKFYDKFFAYINIKTILLPSTSPMIGKNVKSYQDKLVLWKNALLGG